MLKAKLEHQKCLPKKKPKHKEPIEKPMTKEGNMDLFHLSCVPECMFACRSACSELIPL